jgi:hypothetical protein
MANSIHMFVHSIVVITSLVTKNPTNEHVMASLTLNLPEANSILICLWYNERSRDSSGSIVSDYGRSGFDPRRGQRIFPLVSVSRPALGPTQPPVQWVQGVLSPGVKRGRGVMLTTHPHLVPRS